MDPLTEDDHHHYHPQQQGKAATSTIVQTQARRKTTGTRSWLIISETGELLTQEMEKHSIMRRTGMPARDVTSGCSLSYPSSILGRERAIVVNLNHMKSIITANEVLMVNINSPLNFQFVQDLQCRILSSRDEEHRKMEGDHARNHGSSSRRSTETNDFVHNKDGGRRARNSGTVGSVGDRRCFHSNFGALECCLELACRCLESETHTLEEEAYRVLDELTSNITSNH